MMTEAYTDTDLLQILRNVKSIAMVGASAKWQRPSYFAMKYLQEKGYRVFPVNPGVAGSEILGETVYASLADVPAPFEMVDVFRSSEAALGIAQETVALADEKGIRVFWTQLGVINHEAAALAREAGLQVVMDRCPKIEFGRLNAELSWGGFNSRVISARRRRLA